MSRTYKKRYTKSKSFDKLCRCHGGCPYCKNNRLYNDTKYRKAADDEIEEWVNGDFSVEPIMISSIKEYDLTVSNIFQQPRPKEEKHTKVKQSQVNSE